MQEKLLKIGIGIAIVPIALYGVVFVNFFASMGAREGIVEGVFFDLPEPIMRAILPLCLMLFLGGAIVIAVSFFLSKR